MPRNGSLWVYRLPVGLFHTTPLMKTLESSLLHDAKLSDAVAWVLKASRSGYLSRHKEQVMLRVTHQYVQLDAHKVALLLLENERFGRTAKNIPAVPIQT